MKAKAAAEACAAAEVRATTAESARDAAETARLAAERARRYCIRSSEHASPPLSVHCLSQRCSTTVEKYSPECTWILLSMASHARLGGSNANVWFAMLLSEWSGCCRDTEAQAQAAAAAAEAERGERAAAQGLSVQLKAEAERRAKVFHIAVKVGVAKVQAELEAERDSLEARCAYVSCPTPTAASMREVCPCLQSFLVFRSAQDGGIQGSSAFTIDYG